MPNRRYAGLTKSRFSTRAAASLPNGYRHAVCPLLISEVGVGHYLATALHEVVLFKRQSRLLTLDKVPGSFTLHS